MCCSTKWGHEFHGSSLNLLRLKRSPFAWWRSVSSLSTEGKTIPETGWSSTRRSLFCSSFQYKNPFVFHPTLKGRFQYFFSVAVCLSVENLDLFSVSLISSKQRRRKWTHQCHPHMKCICIMINEWILVAVKMIAINSLGGGRGFFHTASWVIRKLLVLLAMCGLMWTWLIYLSAHIRRSPHCIKGRGCSDKTWCQLFP